MANDANKFGLPLSLGNPGGAVEPYIEKGVGSPNGTLTRPQGSLFLRTDVAQLWQNTDGATTWVQAGAGGGTPNPLPDGFALGVGAGDKGRLVFDTFLVNGNPFPGVGLGGPAAPYTFPDDTSNPFGPGWGYLFGGASISVDVSAGGGGGSSAPPTIIYGGSAEAATGDATVSGGPVLILAGDGTKSGFPTATASGAPISIQAGNGPDLGGDLNLAAGSSVDGPGGNVNIDAGQSTNGAGGDVNITGGDGQISGGSVVIETGDGAAPGSSGQILLRANSSVVRCEFLPGNPPSGNYFETERVKPTNDTALIGRYPGLPGLWTTSVTKNAGGTSGTTLWNTATDSGFRVVAIFMSPQAIVGGNLAPGDTITFRGNFGGPILATFPISPAAPNVWSVQGGLVTTPGDQPFIELNVADVAATVVYNLVMLVASQ